MPESVTVPDVLKAHAAEIWRSAFLSSYDGTCKERGDQRESCAASIAWSAVKEKYQKDAQGEWVERESPVAIIDTVPVEDTPKALDRVDPETVKNADWLEAFIYALSGPCASSETPLACAVAFADARFPRDVAGEPEVQAVTAEVAEQVEAVSRSAGVHPNDYGDLSLPLVLRKDYSPEKRSAFAAKGWALPDGSFPIADKADLMDAIHSLVRASEGTRGRVKAHITKRARELGATTQVPSEQGDKTGKPEEKSTPALSERALLRAKDAEADARLLETPEADKVIVRPSHVGSNEWMARPLALRTLRAQIVERTIQRSYDDAVEMTTAEGWQPISNPTRAGEYVFQRWLDTPDGQLLQRAILVRKSSTYEWRLRELTRGASLSLAVQVPADERRWGDDRPFELMTRGGPGSGHFSHEGRPGQRGGSAPGDGGGGESTTISEGRRGALPLYDKGSEAPRPSVADSKGAVKDWLASNGIEGMQISGKTVGFSDLARESVPFVTVKGWTPEIGPDKADALTKYAADHGFRVEFKGGAIAEEGSTISEARVSDYKADDWNGSVNKLAGLPLEELRNRQDINKEQLATWSAHPDRYGDKAGLELDMIQVMLAQAVDKREFGGEPGMPDRFVQEQMAVNPPTAQETKQQDAYEGQKAAEQDAARANQPDWESEQRKQFESGKMDEEGTTISNADAGQVHITAVDAASTKIPGGMQLLTAADAKALPTLYSHENAKDEDIPVPVKLFDPGGAWTFYATEASKEGDDIIMFGLTTGLDYPEMGYQSMNELKGTQNRMGLGMERDRSWDPKTTLADVKTKEGVERSMVRRARPGPFNISRDQARSLLTRAFGKVFDR